MPVYDFKTGEGRRYGYIDPNGNLQIPYQYEYAEPFCNGYAWVQTRDERNYIIFKLINTQGQVVLSLEEMQYPASNISEFYHNGLCLINDWQKQPNMYRYINLQGEVIYSWPTEPKTQDSNAPEMQESDRDAMLLRMFEGTEYYPLAEQCVRGRKTLANTNE